MITCAAKRKAFLSVLVFKALALAGSRTTDAATWVLPDRGSWMGPTGLALGGALAAHSGRSDFIYSNPAAPAFEEKYTFGFSYVTGGDQMRVQVVDTKSSQLGGGLSFAQRNVDNVEKYEDAAFGGFRRLEHSAVGSLMTKLSNTVAVGVSGHHRYIRPSGASLPARSFWSGDLGVMVRVDGNWTLGLSGVDLIADSTGYSTRTLTVGVAGAHLVPGLVVLAQLDFLRKPEGERDTGFVNDESGASYAIAAEYMLNGDIKLRTSYRGLPSWEQQYLGLGLSYSRDSFGLEYGLRISPKNSKAQYHAIGLTVDI